MTLDEEEELELLELERERSQQPKGAFGRGIDFIKNNPREAASMVYRPALEAGGAVAGGLIGTPLLPPPLGTAAGGAIGYAGGKSAADLADRLIGLKTPLRSPKEAATETAGNIYQGAENELMGLGIGSAVRAAGKPLAKTAGVVGRLQSGVRRQSGERLFKNPKAFISPSTESVGRKLGSVRAEKGMLTKPSIDDVVDTQGSVARRTAKDVLKKIEANKASASSEISAVRRDISKLTKERSGGGFSKIKTIPTKEQLARGREAIEKIKERPKASPQELLKGKQAINRLIEKTPIMERNQRRLLSEAGQEINDALYALSPEERSLASKYANAALAEEFRKFYPVTKTGDVSLTRTLFLPALKEPGQALAAIPTVLGQSPALAGAEIAGAGLAYKGAKNLTSNPSAMRGMLALIRALQQRKEKR